VAPLRVELTMADLQHASLEELIVNEESFKLINDNCHTGDITLQRVRIALNDYGPHNHPATLRQDLLCAIAHLQSAADYLTTIVGDDR
jgi:hypothetical protein